MATKSKRRNSEEAIKDPVLALYFLQQKEMRLEGLGELGNAPKISIVTRSYYAADEAEALNKASGAKDGDKNFIRPNQLKDTKHTDAPLYKAEDGAYTLFVPDIYKRDPAEKYLINDAVFEVESFTIADHTAWNRHMHDHKLFELFARQAEVLDEINALTPTDDEMNGLRKEIPQLVASRDTLIERYNALLLDDAASEETVKNALGRRKLAEARLKEARERLKEGEKGTDALNVAQKAAPLSEKLEGLNEESYHIYMEFAHKIAEREELTTNDFATWYAAADEQSKANAMGFVSAGNARRTSGKAARPMTREEERAREYDRLRKLAN